MTLSLEPNLAEQFRESTRKSPPIVLRRQKCDCGKTVKAKQMLQYGKCETCRAGK